jgi:hypothetical protein
LFKIIPHSNSDELKIFSFCLRNFEFDVKTFKTFRYFKTNEIKYIIHHTYENEIDIDLIYIIVNTDENYFFSLDYATGKITEFSIPKEIGFSPTFQKLNDYYFIAIGGINCNKVHLYDIYNNSWYKVGEMFSSRIGAYALLNNDDSTVYICGGINDDGENSLDIEYFHLEYHFDPERKNNQNIFEKIQVKKLSNDYLLRKINPVCIPFEENSYLICGGANIFTDTSTCFIYWVDKDLITTTNLTLPKVFKNNSNNQNIKKFKNSYYFFISENEILQFNLIDKKFILIKQ